jgi:hypothetical protein
MLNFYTRGIVEVKIILAILSISLSVFHNIIIALSIVAFNGYLILC